MARTDLAAITDAGPLIHLDELNCMDLLDGFSRVLIVDAVWREVAYHRPVLFQYRSFTRCIAPNQPDIIQTLTPLYGLHDGEREALTLCLTNPESIFLTDDTAARMAAKALGIGAHGTIGIILRAIRTSQRTKQEALKILDSIPLSSSLHIRRSLLDEVMMSVEKSII